MLTTESQLTTPNRTVDAPNGVTFAYRRFGNADGTALPLVCFQHNRGNLDNWDPALVDALAFIEALGLKQIDILGYSMGGFVAQELTLIRPQYLNACQEGRTSEEASQAAELYMEGLGVR
jgi:pimeloyl-ACP methyl ester carboxylesterase